MLNGNRTKSNKGRSPRDLYITPPELADAAFRKLRIDEEFSNKFPLATLDAGCGKGVWGAAMNGLLSYVLGIDIMPTVKPGLYYDDVYAMDYLSLNVIPEFDLVIGNPPYSLAEEFIRHSFDLLEDNGYIYFLLRLSFLEGITRGKGLFKEFPIKRVYVCSRRPSFFSTNGKHTTDTLAYAMFLC